MRFNFVYICPYYSYSLGLQSITVPLDLKNYKTAAYSCHSKICGDHVEAWDCGNDVSEWLFQALNISGLRLLRQCSIEENVSRLAKGI